MSVVVGYVATAEGDAALTAAVEEVRRRGSRLVVVLSERSSRFGSETGALEEQVEEVRRRLDEADVPYDVRQTVRGRDVADDIISAAESTGGELIVMGLRRRSPVGKLILGSNAQRILLDAPCPVLAVKPVRT
ncbi:universal stress protein [Actinotalea sp. C106]|uniref:universal stress protein n=1 Tax=Actinotalea sp. C106 TaxID=2908644 RepID=UPI0020282781|nr:universal stress protein [Actinotalea sp. C106]